MHTCTGDYHMMVPETNQQLTFEPVPYLNIRMYIATDS